MNHQDFIYQNVKDELVKLGFDPDVASIGANKAIDQFRTHSSSSRKGKLFDDCLRIGKEWAAKYQPKKKN
ncbi:hypothetical protein [Yersinia mollaretii]|uniref:hypothetical protein n=2 Tax=Yersinia mollaretii TaxID=33060 RepID=UPI002E0FFC04|nr:hypothetical protein U1Z61_15145 [Yersinia mollaretii]